MTFWVTSTGQQVSGNERDSFTNNFTQIPNNTYAKGVIVKTGLNTKFTPNFYEVTYKIIDGDYKECLAVQKLKCFEEPGTKRDRALNMLARLFLLGGLQLPLDKAPNEFDLMPLIGKVMGIRIQEWQTDKGEGNWISEVHLPDTNFVTKTGTKLIAKPIGQATTSGYGGDDYSNYAKTTSANKEGSPDGLPW